MTILTALGACQKNEVTSLSEDVTIHATIEEKDATRTVMDESNNILWTENDQIIAFMKSSYGHKYQVKPSFVGKSYADFSMVSSNNGSDLSAGNEWEHNVVYYPYSEDIECLKSGANYALEINLPSEQVYVPDSFANGSMAMVAVSESNNITFKNVLGAIKLQLKGTQTVKSIKIEGKNNEKLSGAAIVTAYTDDTKPAITMASGASTSVTLYCGEGVQLNESTATEFIISLPPVLFGSGFTLTVTDAENKTYTIETDKANTVLRSSLLTMPSFKLGNNPSEEQPGDDELIVPVSYVNLSSISLELYEGNIAQLTATVGPKDATDKTVIWSSDNPAVVSVDQTGLVAALSAGTASVMAASGGKFATCTITVSALDVVMVDYIDEYGVNHGKGTIIGLAVWAPVNCGYHKDNFKYGKLYQWGRKYGQGYNGECLLYNVESGGWRYVEDYFDAILPVYKEGGVSVITGNHSSNSNVYFDSNYIQNGDWVDPSNDDLWNSGSESSPVKTQYDPCPDGWRVPTINELSYLAGYSSDPVVNESGQSGCWVSGASVYSLKVPQIFLPTAGYRSWTSGSETGDDRGMYGYYWASSPSGNSAKFLSFTTDPIIGSYYGNTRDRACGLSVRCVQE
jgi:uncharacterized protein (TIGR02145 family)